jgi:hypothetical protein
MVAKDAQGNQSSSWAREITLLATVLNRMRRTNQMGNWYVSKPDNDGERELLDRAVKALEAELATKTCNKQIASKLEDAELARDSEETCNNKQVISKLVASEDAISRQAAKEAVKRASASGTVQMLLMEILDGMPSVNPMPCEDVISRQAAIDELKKYFSDEGMKDTECGAYWHHGHVIDVLQGMQPVTPKQRTGHWIECEEEVKCFCSECKEISDYPTQFCPNCGAKMESEDKE